MHETCNCTVASRCAVTTIGRGIVGMADPASLVEED